MATRGEALFDDAVTALENDEPVKACRLLEQVVALDPADAEAGLLLAQTYRDRGQDAPAERTLARLAEALADEPEDSIDVLVELADVRLALGDPQGASVPIRAVLALQPNHAETLFLLGNAFLDLGHKAEAAKAFQASLDSNPFSAEVWYNLALVQTDRGDLQDARRAWTTFLSCGPSDEDRAYALSELARLGP